jgi:hypothetical protein
MYITYANVLERYPMLKTWSANSPYLNNDITYAEQELNGRLATHFSVPFSGAHPTIKDLAIDLVYYRSLRLKDPDHAEKFKESIIGRIEGLKKGDEYIYTDSNTTIEADATKAGEVWSNLEDYHPTFSMLDAENAKSVIDPDRIEAEEDERT